MAYSTGDPDCNCSLFMRQLTATLGAVANGVINTTMRRERNGYRVASGRPGAGFFADGIGSPYLSSKGPDGTAGRDRLVSQGVHRRLNGRVPVARCERRSDAAAGARYFAASVDSVETNRAFAESLGLALSDSERSDARNGAGIRRACAERLRVSVDVLHRSGRPHSGHRQEGQRRRRTAPTWSSGWPNSQADRGVRLERVWQCSTDSAPRPGTNIPTPRSASPSSRSCRSNERELLAEIARDDADARVRRAAVAKLMDPAALAGVARQDADEQVRAQAVAHAARHRARGVRRRRRSREPRGGRRARRCEDARRRLPRTRRARSTAQRALSRISDPHALGSIARHAEHEPVRLRAFESLQDHAEILAHRAQQRVQGSDARRRRTHRRPRRARADRVACEEQERVEARARDAARDATIARAADAAGEGCRRAAPTRDARPGRGGRARQPPTRLPPTTRRGPRRTEAAQREADARAQQDEARRQIEEADAARRRPKRRRRSGPRAEAAEQDAERRAARLAELAEEAAAAAAVEDLAAARKQFAAIRQRMERARGRGPGRSGGRRCATRTPTPPSPRATAAARDAEDAREAREALVRLQQLAARVEALAARDRSRAQSRRARAARRARRARVDAAAAVEAGLRRGDAPRLKAAQAALTPKVQELREVADWQRWANVGIQEQLCEKMEALKARRRSRGDRARRSASCSSSGVRPPTCRARRARRCGSASRRRTTRRGRGAKRISPRRPASAPTTSRRRSRSASAPRRSPIRPTGFRPPTRSRSCRPSGRRSAR